MWTQLEAQGNFNQFLSCWNHPFKSSCSVGYKTVKIQHTRPALHLSLLKVLHPLESHQPHQANIRHGSQSCIS